MRHALARWVILLVVTGALCVYLAGNQSVGLFDRDEPRYAQTSRQMLKSGDWVVPRFLDRVRTAKPVLIYWTQASAMAVLGDTRFAARLPSALAMASTVGMLAIAVGRAAGRRRGLWTAFILSSSVLAIVAAKICLTDAMLLLFITASQLCLYRLWKHGPDGPTILLLGLSVGLAGLTKGPVSLGVNATTLLALWIIGRTVKQSGHAALRHVSPWRAEHFPLVAGVAGAVLVAVVFPWLWEVQMRSPGFLTKSISHDVIDRMQRGAEGHSAPPGTYSLLVWGTFFPWSLLLPASLVWAWKRRHVPAMRFALAAAAGPWVMFELVATKLPHYVLPTYPALAYLTADLLFRAGQGRVKDFASKVFHWTAWGWAGLVAMAGLATPVVVMAVGNATFTEILGAFGVAAIAVFTAVRTGLRFWANRPRAAARAMGCGTLATVAVAYLLVLPDFGPLRLTRDVAAIFIRHDAYAADGLMIDFKEPSLAFEQGGGLREESDNDYLNTTAAADWPAWVVTTRRVWDATRPDVQDRWDVAGTATGVAYSARGRSHEVLVLRRR